MRVVPLPVAGCCELVPALHRDARGHFAKPFARAQLAALGIDLAVEEVFWSTSARGVVRGLHFQTPPSAVAKLVTAVAGRAYDVMVDVRVGSPTYGAQCAVTLDAERGNAVFVPEGVAHGFQALEDATTLVYLQSRAFSAADDAGLHYDSAGVEWPLLDPTVSARDAALPVLDGYRSPFVFGASTS